MLENNKTYRIKTNINSDSFVNIKLENNIDSFELLSLKIKTDNFYKYHTSDYGCVVGRVLANGNVGIPNAKISIFIQLDSTDQQDIIISKLYPYANIHYRDDSDTLRYNLLPDEQVNLCHSKTGSFPNKRLVLDDDNVIEVFDKYYKYTTRSNNSGDYMIFGVPVGNQILHTDIDLSDIGFLSQKPVDMMYKGYNITNFDSPSKFKSDNELDNLAQIVTQNDSIYVFPFWADTELDEYDDIVKITRNDINVNYKFEPTCIFLGSIVTDEKSQGVTQKCTATEQMGKMDKLTTGQGTIEMIRKTIGGNVEEFSVQGNQLIDGNGTWCYQIPMNLDYFMTDERGNFVPTDDPNKGIPTRARVRFRISLADYTSDYENSHLTKVLVPNNPKTEDELDYVFGTNTKDSDDATKSYRDLFWNNVYSIKSFIPRIQNGNNQRNQKFIGIKYTNANGGNNPIPYNNMRVHLSFMFILQCAIFKALIKIADFTNRLIDKTGLDVNCATIGNGLCPQAENTYFAPSCKKIPETQKELRENENDEAVISFYDTEYFIKCVELNLAMENNVIQFDFYNDWINGMLYIPRWFANLKKKKTYLFGGLRQEEYVDACFQDTFNQTRYYTQQCALDYTLDNEGHNTYTRVVTADGCVSTNKSKLKCHQKDGRKQIGVFGLNGGLIKRERTLKGQKVYYAKPCEWINGIKCNMFATDIILLGNINQNNVYGIPQAFTELTSTTYLLPPTVVSMNNDNYTLSSTGIPVANSGESEYTVTEYSGIDWQYYGPNQDTNHSDYLYNPGGHFLSISCGNSETNIKSCVNLSRICEVSTTMSQRHTLSKKTSNKEITAYLIPTGFISKDEINDSKFRTIFATLNYNGLKTVRDKDSNLLKYDFVSLNPTNFGGELSDRINNKYYNSNRGQDDKQARPMSDSYAYTRALEYNSQDYYKFRMGVECKTVNDAVSKYLIKNGTEVSMPVYENSFYFYFGLKDGNTAIDRFFKNFYSECVNGELENGYSIEVTSKNNELCDIYDGSVSVEIYGLTKPYKVLLTDLYGVNIVIDEYKIDADGNPIYLVNKGGNKGIVYISNHKFTIDGLSDGDYVIYIGSSLDNMVERKFSISRNIPDTVLKIDYEAVQFNTLNNDIEYNFNRDVASIEDGYVLIKNIPHTEVAYICISDKMHYYDILINANGTIFKETDFRKLLNNNNIILGDRISDSQDYNNFLLTDKESDLYDYKIPVWNPNGVYNVYIYTFCSTNYGEYNFKLHNIDGIEFITGDNFDIYFYDKTVRASQFPKELFLETEDYVTEAFSDYFSSSAFTYTNYNCWALAKALFYDTSMYDVNGYGGINVGFISNNSFTTVIHGTSENIESDAEKNKTSVQLITNEESSAYRPTYGSFRLPTHLVTTGRSIYNLYNIFFDSLPFNTDFLQVTADRNGIYKNFYKITATDDKTGEIITCNLPSIYKPKFINSIIYITKKQISCHTCFYNLTPYNNLLNNITIELGGKQLWSQNNITINTHPYMYDCFKQECEYAVENIDDTFGAQYSTTISYIENTGSNNGVKKQYTNECLLPSFVHTNGVSCSPGAKIYVYAYRIPKDDKITLVDISYPNPLSAFNGFKSYPSVNYSECQNGETLGIFSKEYTNDMANFYDITEYFGDFSNMTWAQIKKIMEKLNIRGIYFVKDNYTQSRNYENIIEILDRDKYYFSSGNTANGSPSIKFDTNKDIKYVTHYNSMQNNKRKIDNCVNPDKDNITIVKFYHYEDIPE